jgi:hypothetical protein
MPSNATAAEAEMQHQPIRSSASSPSHSGSNTRTNARPLLARTPLRELAKSCQLVCVVEQVSHILQPPSCDYPFMYNSRQTSWAAGKMHIATENTPSADMRYYSNFLPS